MMNVWLSGERLQVSELRPENKALFRISKTPKIKTQGNAFDGYWLTQMKVTREDIKPLTALPKYAQKAVAAHQKRTGGKR